MTTTYTMPIDSAVDFRPELFTDRYPVVLCNPNEFNSATATKCGETVGINVVDKVLYIEWTYFGGFMNFDYLVTQLQRLAALYPIIENHRLVAFVPSFDPNRLHLVH